ncbi:hypothetical protein [Gordonia sp. VNK21]|uniref:hypothetical protein n=1 Tax=Gordonia sp. VNK21 TaxID=3382483 RepID=UPI0038D48E52
MSFSRRSLLALLTALLAIVALAGCSDEAESSRPGAALPKDFPTAQVPMIDGAVLDASGGDSSWQVMIQAQASDGNAFTNAVSTLTDAGYTESSRTDNDRERSVLLSKRDGEHTYWVNVGISATSSGTANSILYAVTRE